jgi:broad specificity phosphatase PhoE
MRHGDKLFENGELDINKGHVDAPLTHGNDIKRQKAFMGNVKLIVTSPYLRCRQTAEIISDGEIPIVIDQDLREYVRWSAERAYPPVVEPSTEDLLIDQDSEDSQHVKIAESKKEFSSRVKRFAAKTWYFQDNVLIVSHAAVLKNLAKIIFGKDISFQMGMFVSILRDPVEDILDSITL